MGRCHVGGSCKRPKTGDGDVMLGLGRGGREGDRENRLTCSDGTGLNCLGMCHMLL